MNIRKAKLTYDFFFSKNNNKTNKLLKYCSYAQMVFGRMCWLRQSK